MKASVSIFAVMHKYLKQRIMYSYGYPRSLNPAFIMKEEANMIH